ncbi:MAG TPA: response regulator [Proteobacteria bacterium]|nr:response regulator [Pseudomonadota bacterium]
MGLETGFKGEPEMEEAECCKRILVMDDEEVIRAVCVDLLSSLGYQVDSVVDGREMLSRYQTALEQGCPYALVFMDLTIQGGGLGGREAMVELLKLDPQAKGIVCSGYTHDPVMLDCRAYGFYGKCAKPFNFKVLNQVICEALS